jgi:hypothetical protein
MHPQPTGDERGRDRQALSRLGWQTPQVTPLPRLIHLTLVTGDAIPGGGGTGGGGSTVIPG